MNFDDFYLKVAKNPDFPFAKIPQRSNSSAVAFDLFTPEEFTLQPHDFITIDLGIVLEFPDGYMGRILPRSGLATKSHVFTGAGVIDPDYRGNLKVFLYTSDRCYHCYKGDKIAQIAFIPVYSGDIQEVSFNEINHNTQRGTGGFGSTGK